MSVFMGINTMFWNCQGVRSKRNELELYLKENNFDKATLNETFLTKKIDFKIQGYDTIKSNRLFNWFQRWSYLPRKTCPSY